MIMSRWKKRLEMIRRGKDKYFRGSPQSPLTAEEREGFKGLVYYPIDPGYRFELELDEYDEKTPVRLEATHGEQRVVLRVGKFQFDIRNQECTLHAYQVDPDQQRLFVPFTDTTSGVDTHDKGRYLDLEPEIHRTIAGKWILDFNEAYNPWCEYAEDFSCLIAPPENRLNVPVRAGEKSYANE
ncbi:MAG: DUF1684 domain-containing protein [Gemmatimonadales bacterium]|jgi:uncharacterized protein (DUF1684 family)